MPDEIRSVQKPYKVLAANRYVAFETLNEACDFATLVKQNEVLMACEARNRCDDDGFTDWKMSYDQAALKINNNWEEQ